MFLKIYLYVYDFVAPPSVFIIAISAVLDELHNTPSLAHRHRINSLEMRRVVEHANVNTLIFQAQIYRGHEVAGNVAGRLRIVRKLRQSSKFSKNLLRRKLEHSGEKVETTTVRHAQNYMFEIIWNITGIGIIKIIVTYTPRIVKMKNAVLCSLPFAESLKNS